MDLLKLADELIERRCGKHSLANVYEYLLRAYGDANRAKADFIRFLSGELPIGALEAAAEWIAEEQGADLEAESNNGQLTIGPCPVVADRLQPNPCRG